MELIKSISVIVIFFTALLGCGKNVSYIENKIIDQNVLGQSLQGVYTDTDGNIIDLDQLGDKVTVLIFAQDTCQVCSEEATELSAYAKINGDPKAFELRHLLVASVIDDAIDWKLSHQITWSVGTTNVDLFKMYCPLQQVPCLVVFKPNMGSTFQHTGKLSIEQIKKETGGWEN